MISRMQDMVAPLSEQQFLTLLRTRTLCFQRNSGDNRFAGLLDWGTLRGVIESGAIPTHELTVTRNESRVAPMFYRNEEKVDASKLAALLDRGGSVIARRVDQHVPALAALCDDVRARIADEVSAGAIVTNGAGGAIPPHYDFYDIAILQIEGGKRWTIHDCPVANPIEGMPRQPAPKGVPIFDEVLRPGDFLFVPSGYWHHCENGQGRSLHVGILLQSITGWHALRGLLQQLLDEDLFRTPLTRLAGDAERAAHEAALKRRLVEAIERMSLFDMAADPQLHSTDKMNAAGD